MESAKNRYHIIKFTSGLPYPSCCGYECIPKTWVTFHDPDKGAAVIKFPGQPVNAATDIQNLKKFDPSWSQFVVQVIFSTENYEEASTSLKLFQTDTSNVTAEEKNTDHELTSKRTPRPSRPKAQTPSPAKTKRTPSKEIEPKVNRIKKKKVIRRPNKKVIKKTLKNGMNQHSTNINIQPYYNESIGDPEVLKKLDEIESVFNAAQAVLNKLHVDNHSELMTKILNVFDLNNENEDLNENTDKYKGIDNEKVLLTPYVSVNRLDFGTTNRKPENSSAWTLRYPIPGPDLVELLPNSEVYVNRANLKSYQSLGCGKKLASSLLTEIFSDEALKKCSVTGGKNQFRRTGVVCPPLDKNARTVLFKYVIRRTKQRKWPVVTHIDIAKLLGTKLCMMRKSK